MGDVVGAIAATYRAVLRQLLLNVFEHRLWHDTSVFATMGRTLVRNLANSDPIVQDGIQRISVNELTLGPLTTWGLLAFLATTWNLRRYNAPLESTQ